MDADPRVQDLLVKIEALEKVLADTLRTTISFPLRADVSVEIRGVPRDMTRQEADRLKCLIDLLLNEGVGQGALAEKIK